MIKMSIASTFYNDKEMMKKVLDSVLNQTYQNIEHCVADGGSTDGSVELLKEYEEKYRQTGKTLRWVSERDNGITDGFNKAVKMATGDYIFPACCDPYAGKTVMEHTVSIIEEKKPDYVYGGMYFQRDGKNIRNWSGKPGNWRLGWMMATPTICMKRELMEKLGPSDLSYRAAADYKVQLQMFLDKSLTSASLNRKIVMYSAGGASNGGLKNKLNSINECFRVYKELNIKMGWFINLCKTIRGVCSYIFVSRKKIVLEDE